MLTFFPQEFDIALPLLADVKPYSPVFNEVALWGVVKVEHVRNNALVDQHDQGWLAHPLLTAVGVEVTEVEETVLVLC